MKFLFSIILVIQSIIFFAQSNFSSLTSGVLNNKEVKCIFGDSVTNLVYVGGAFTLAGGLPVTQIASWDGASWDSLSSGINDGGRVFDIDRYNGKIIAAGTFDQIGGIYASGLAAWDGSNWTPLVQLKDRDDYPGVVISILVDGGDLIIAGSFDSLNGLPANSIARFDGSNWFSYPPLDTTSLLLAKPTIYNGELYVIGNIWDPSLGYKGIARFDGATWLPVGTGFSLGAITNALAVYNNELYIGGYFSSPNDPGNMLVKWNGTNYIPLPVTPNWQVHELKVIGGKLYVGGLFLNVGSLSNSAFCARLNGVIWESTGGAFDNGVSSFTALNGDIFIGGGFWTVNGDTMNAITRYVGAVGVNESSIQGTLSIFQNDGRGNVVVIIPSGLEGPCTFSVFDVNGKLLNQFASKGETRIPVNLSDRPAGIYFIRCRVGEGLEAAGLVLKVE